MSPTIILIRHGEAEHNATFNYDILDPKLTEKGQQQCHELEQQLRKDLPLADSVEAIISSPFTRTLETTILGLDWLIQRGIKIEIDPLWQECSAKPCDTGSSAAITAKRFPSVDFTSLDPVYPYKGPETIYAFTKKAVIARGETCLRNLCHRPEKVIAVVSHSGFLRTAISQRQYANADYRIFTFKEPLNAEGTPHLIESEITAGRAGMGMSQPGVAPVFDRDFPAEKKIESVKMQQGDQTSTEATAEVPK